ncbi:MAG: ArnT family glycosyltransferase [Planctomycetota bacterium]
MPNTRHFRKERLTLSKRRSFLFAVFAACLACRVVFLLFYHHGPVLQKGTLIRHVSIARNLLAGHGWKQEFDIQGELFRVVNGKKLMVDPEDWPPIRTQNLKEPAPTDTVGYAVLLAGIWAVTGKQIFLWVQLLQIVLDSLVCLALYAIVHWQIGKRSLAGLAAILYAVFLPAARMAVNPHRDIWAVYGVVFALYFVTLYVQRRRWWSLLLSAGVLAICCWMRPNILLIPPVLGFGLWLSRRLTLAKSCAVTVVQGIGLFLLFILPFVRYNQAVYGRPWVVCSGLGAWERYGEFDNPFGCKFSDVAAAEYVRSKGYDYPLYSEEFDNVLSERVREIESEAPFLKYVNMARRAPQFMFCGFSDVFTFPKELLIREYMRQPDKTYLTYVLEHPLVFLAKYGIAPLFWAMVLLGIIVDRKRWRKNLLFALIAAYYIGLCCRGHFENRYVVVGMWSTLYFVAAVLVWAYHAIASKLNMRETFQEI